MLHITELLGMGTNSVHRADITTCFAIISEQLRDYYEHYKNYVPVATAFRVLGLRMKETASRGQPTRGGPPILEVLRGANNFSP